MGGMLCSVRRLLGGFLVLMALLLAGGGVAAEEEGHAAQWNGEPGQATLAEQPPTADDGGAGRVGDTASDSVFGRLFDPVSSGVIVAVSWGVLAVLLVMRRRVAKTS